jgi:uncharacterized protein
VLHPGHRAEPRRDRGEVAPADRVAPDKEELWRSHPSSSPRKGRQTLLYPSVYNFTVPLGGGWHALVNLLAGSLDVVDDALTSSLLPTPASRHLDVPTEVERYLDARGYLWADLQQERSQAALLRRELLEFHRNSVRQTLVVIPSYHCNLRCGYCWQRLYGLDSPIMTREVMDHLFDSIPQVVQREPGREAEIIVFGGEPLAEIPELRQRVLDILERSSASGYSTKIVTNGVGLAAAAPYLAGRADVIQVTIDGPPDVHRRRRPLPGGDSYEPLRRGVNEALRAGLRINIRVNADLQNLPTLPDLAAHIRDQGWLETGLLTVHLAPVKNHNSRKETIAEERVLHGVLDLAASDERMSVFSLDGFAGIKYFDSFMATGLLPLHRFFHCEAQMNFYAFDLNGDIYACWDAAGLPSLAVGRYLPEVAIDSEKLALWRDRDGMAISACEGCVALPSCGGGCAFLAYEHAGAFTGQNCDSLLEAFKSAVARNADWILSRAHAGDHCVGLVRADEVITPVTRQFAFHDRAQLVTPEESC